jgi:hypothetical protein
MNPAADADVEDILDSEREAIKLRMECEGCGVALSVGPEERGRLDKLVRAHLNTAAERYGTPCSEETLATERVYSDGTTEAI